jgi:hypothetical protein
MSRTSIIVPTAFADRAGGKGDRVKRAVFVDENLFALLLVVLRKDAVNRAFFERVRSPVRPRVVNVIMKRLVLQFLKAVAGQLLGRRVHKNAVLTLVHDKQSQRRVIGDRFQLTAIIIFGFFSGHLIRL